MDNHEVLEKLELPEEYRDLLFNCQKLVFAHDVNDLIALSVLDGKDTMEIGFEVPGKGYIKEAWVSRVKNGIAANYYDPYLRRRDPDSMIIGDDNPSDKIRYKDLFHEDFSKLRKETLDWLKNQELAAFCFAGGQMVKEFPGIAIVPLNCGFFALGLALLQGLVKLEKIEGKFKPKIILTCAPPFRHTHFEGKQRVVHYRTKTTYEIFSYNLYPGPSAKKGVYGALIHFGEQEGWVVNHCATVQVITPYDNKIVIMHEGASGGGKSEMNEFIHREAEGAIRLGTNTVTGQKKYLYITRTCALRPISDDMALCHPSFQKNDGKIHIADAERGWFIRVDHIKQYGTDPEIEKLSIHAKAPLLFLNIDAQPNSTALVWEHIEDSPGKKCPNPRFILRRSVIPRVINSTIGVDIRSFGVRCPPCTAEKPSYGILGLFHILPPAIAWLWRLVAPRGHDNPSITDTEGMSSEGVGSYWPFATGIQVVQANLLLKQILEAPEVSYILCPAKHVGAWEVSFMPQWITREFLPRRGRMRFSHEELKPANFVLLGYTLKKMTVEGQEIDPSFLDVSQQREVGDEAFKEGAKILLEFFRKELKKFHEDPHIDPLGRKIIELVYKDNTKIEDFEALIPSKYIYTEE
jgi:hypothetical protein